MRLFRGWESVTLRLEDREHVEGIAPVIVSASRRTDVPAFHAQWFFDRLRAGHVKWMNPFSGRPQYDSFAKTRAIVFWTKNPRPLLPYLSELDQRGIGYYVQFTLNDYETEGLEPNLPLLASRIETFCELSGRVGRSRVVWRFDPILVGRALAAEAVGFRILL